MCFLLHKFEYVRVCVLLNRYSSCGEGCYLERLYVKFYHWQNLFYAKGRVVLNSNIQVADLVV